MTPNVKTKEDIGETITLEQYLSVVSPEPRCWILECSPSSAKEVMEMVEVFTVVRMVDGDIKLGNNNKYHHHYKPVCGQ
ncbi:hypothetical protein SRHO_G00177590 [Serrasalmus rhombeus]